MSCDVDAMLWGGGGGCILASSVLLFLSISHKHFGLGFEAMSRDGKHPSTRHLPVGLASLEPSVKDGMGGDSNLQTSEIFGRTPS